VTTILQARPGQFVNTPSIDRVAKRALRYLQSGYSVHLRGPAGTGKTTLALHLADLLTRPIMLLFGDDEFKTSDLIGNQTGFTRKKVFDNFIHSVVKMEDEVRQNWVDSRLTMACREGFTLVYDEFNRSRPEVNNVLLSALEEKLLVLPPNSSRSEYIRVNPHFRAIFTSNPAEYCGVHATQDALLDRLITINIPEPDELTQQEILVQKTEIDREDAALIVQMVRVFRSEAIAKDSSGLRSCLMIAKVAHEHNIRVDPRDAEFRDLCQDILLARSEKSINESTQVLWDLFGRLNSKMLPLKPSATVAKLETNPAEQTPTAEDYLPGKLERVPSTSQEPQYETVNSESATELPEDLKKIFEEGEHLDSDEAEAIAKGGLVSVRFEPGEDIPDFDLPSLEFSDESLSLSQVALSDDVNLHNEGSDKNQVETASSTGFETSTSVQGQAVPNAVESESATQVDAIPPVETPQSEVETEVATADSSPKLTADSSRVLLSDAAPFEQEVYDYLQQFQNARPSEISEALGISKLETIHALRALSIRGLIAPQTPGSAASSSGTASNGMTSSLSRSPMHASAIDQPLQRNTIRGELP